MNGWGCEEEEEEEGDSVLNIIFKGLYFPKTEQFCPAFFTDVPFFFFFFLNSTAEPTASYGAMTDRFHIFIYLHPAVGLIPICRVSRIPLGPGPLTLPDFVLIAAQSYYHEFLEISAEA